MPRKKNEIKKLIFNKFEFIEQYLAVEANLRNEFMREYQNSPLVRFWYVKNATANYNYVIMLMKHFAFLAYRFLDETQVGGLPTRPAYAKFDPTDTQGWPFWYGIQVSGIQSIPPRSWEESDMDYNIFCESEAECYSQIEKYINAYYFHRKTNKWLGLSAISAVMGFTPEEKTTESECADNIRYDDFIINVGLSPIGTGYYTPENLFKFWVTMKKRYENVKVLPVLQEYIQPEYQTEEIVQISNHNVVEFEIIDKRSERILSYDVEGGITGSLVDSIIWDENKKQIYVFYDITITKLNEILYIVQLNLLVPLTNPFKGENATLIMTFENWLKTKVKLAIEQNYPVTGNPEWFSGNFPKTDFNHMVFYGGHSFYIPDSYVIDQNLTRLTKEAGYLTIKFVTDVFNTTIFLVPMRNTVSYGKWKVYAEPNKALAEQILKKQWWSIAAKIEKVRIVETKEAAVEMGRRGTQIAGIIPGLTALVGLVNTGSGL